MNRPSQISRRVAIETLERRRMFAVGNNLAGTVFDDINGNGVRNTGEPGLANQIVYLDSNKNGLRDAGEKFVATDSTGAYTINNLAAGQYRVRHELPAGRRLTSPYQIFYDVTLPRGIQQTPAEFSNTTRGVVRGSVFDDLNGDGLQQSGEPGLPNWRLFLDKDNDGVYDPGVEKVRLTNSRGEYRFADLTPGNYVLRIEQQAGFRRINPLNGMFKFTITSGKSFSNRSFAQTTAKDDSGTDPIP